MTDTIQDQIGARVCADPERVWTAADFAETGSRDAVDKALQRMTASGDLEKVAWGLYQKPSYNKLTKRKNPPKYAEVLAALERRDATPMLIDGMTAANDLGFTTAVPAKIIVHTSSRRASIDLGGQTIIFKKTAPSKLSWAGRPAMPVVQALQWLRDTGREGATDTKEKLTRILSSSGSGEAIRSDLIENFNRLPAAWLQDLLRPILFERESLDKENKKRG